MGAKIRKSPARARARARILVVDDHPIVRQGLQKLIDEEKDLVVCGEAEGFLDAEAALHDLDPDLVIIDISLKQGDGMQLVKTVRARYPRLPILVLSMHDEVIYAERVLAAGANGYIMKQADSAELLRALRRVLGDGTYVSEAIADTMVRNLSASGRHLAANPIERLSNRELQVLQMIGSGLSTRQAAAALSLSMKTVESHRERIKRKLHLSTGSQLLQFALNWSERSGAGSA